ncbi:YtxH domain-containing protein [Candidatus Uhrbacteria bacterium]|nr:YtxH domain-containing protein [Candidatus Uhrbacteria bacterium]
MKGTLKGAALGALVASAAALLLAPKSGRKTRADLKKLLDTASTDLQKKAKKIQNLSQAQYEELFLHSLAQAARKKEEIVDVLGDVAAVLKKGWSDVRQELKTSKPAKTTGGAKKKK